MASFAKRMPEFDAHIFGVMGDSAIIAGAEVKGIFFRRHREIVLEDGIIAGLDLSFDCQITPAILALQENDSIQIVDDKAYLFGRRIPEDGDESGLVTLELKTPQA